MTDLETLTDPRAQELRIKFVSAVRIYRNLLPLAPIPSYLRQSLADTLTALDRWTVESETAKQQGVTNA